MSGIRYPDYVIWTNQTNIKTTVLPVSWTSLSSSHRRKVVFLIGASLSYNWKLPRMLQHMRFLRQRRWETGSHHFIGGNPRTTECYPSAWHQKCACTDRTFNYNNKRAKELLHLFREYAPDICFHLEIHPALLSEELKEELAILPNGLHTSKQVFKAFVNPY